MALFCYRIFELNIAHGFISLVVIQVIRFIVSLFNDGGKIKCKQLSVHCCPDFLEFAHTWPACRPDKSGVKVMMMSMQQ